MASKRLKVLVCDPLDAKGLSLIQAQKELVVQEAIKASVSQLKKAIKDASGVIVRSGTRLTADIIKEAKVLKIIARAGVGVDNVDVDQASKQGIVVVNTPSGNTISAAEHTMSLMLCMARNVAVAHSSMNQGLWERKKFTGVELSEKCLGLVGLGRIGTEVSKRAQSFNMRVVAYDPFLRPEKARQLGVIQVTLNELYAQADFISMHVPLTKETRNLINQDALKRMKKGVRIINCARGGLIDEEAALSALKSGKIRGLALDVYEEEPPKPSKLLGHYNVLKTPHLGASTAEAQIRVSFDAAKSLVDCLTGKGVRNAVNLPSIEPEILKEMAPYMDLCERLGKFHAETLEGQLTKIDIRYAGRIEEYPQSPLTAHFLKGLLSPILATDVNLINAPYLAKDRGIKISITKSNESTNFTNLVLTTVKTTRGKRRVGGTLYQREDPRIVLVDDMRIESVARGYLLMIENKDVPGMVGHIGSILGKNKVNIADMSVGRNKAKKIAKIFINVDADISERLLRSIRSNKHILNAKFVKFE